MIRAIPIASCLLMLSVPSEAQQPRQIDMQIVRDQLGDAAVATALCNSDAKNAAQHDQAIIADLQKQIADLKAKIEPARATPQ